MQVATRLARASARLHWNQDLVDQLVGVSLAVATLYAAWSNGIRLDAISVPLLVLQTLPVAFRRRSPMLVLYVTGLSITAYSLLGYTESANALGVFLAFYTVAAQEPRRRAIVAAVVTAAGIFVSFAAYASYHLNGQTAQNLTTTYFSFGLAWLIGDNLRVRRAYTKELESRAVELEREREERAVRAVVEERARIARELHDVVAHYVSVMVVQAAGARRVAEKDPATASLALEAVESAGRTALAEMRRMLEVLRTDDPGTGPQPGLGDLDRLIGQVRNVGLPVSLKIEGDSCCLPAAMDLAAYRIIQEALTNTVKHGGKASASVTVRYLPDTLEIEVVDDGRGAAAPLIASSEGGHGLIGMHERVALFGGRLQAGPVLTGGYRVFVTLPIEPEDSARARSERDASLAALQEAASKAEAAAPVGRHARMTPHHVTEPQTVVRRRALPPMIVRVVPPHHTEDGHSHGRRQDRGDE
jgi:signal transduction histidine kinase